MGRRESKAVQALNKSPINYFSDLFVIVMVCGWIVVLIVEVIFAIYGTVVLADLSGWAYVDNTVTIPLTAGGAIWMVKNSVQHAIANNKGEQAHMDFPAVPDTDFGGVEQPMSPSEDDTSKGDSLAG